MGEPIHIRSQVSFSVIKMQALIILQEFPFKNYRNIKCSGRAKVTFGISVIVLISRRSSFALYEHDSQHGHIIIHVYQCWHIYRKKSLYDGLVVSEKIIV